MEMAERALDAYHAEAQACAAAQEDAEQSRAWAEELLRELEDERRKNDERRETIERKCAAHPILTSLKAGEAVQYLRSIGSTPRYPMNYPKYPEITLRSA